MHRITRSLASLTLVCGLSAGLSVAVGAGTAGASHAPATHLAGKDGKNKDGKDLPPKDCTDGLHGLNALVARMSELSEVASTLQAALRSGSMTAENYDSSYRSVNNAAHQVERDFKAAMWIYIEAGCVKALAPIPILPGWTDMEDAAHTLAG